MLTGEDGWLREPQDGCISLGYDPVDARKVFGIDLDDREGGPIWCAQRMGASYTELPDGRIVIVAGEHEDFYDPDFYIYNDVIVIEPNGEFDILGYPRETFPQTDFHTATLVGDRLFLIGSLGYPKERRPGFTQVYTLDLTSYQIDPVETRGAMPGWIHKHEAEHVASRNAIRVRGGLVLEERGGSCELRSQVEEYELDLTTLLWARLTDRNWPQFRIQREDSECFSFDAEVSDLVPEDIEHSVLPCDDLLSARIAVEGIPVFLEYDVDEIRMVIEGSVSEDWALRLAEQVRARTEVVSGCRCVLS